MPYVGVGSQQPSSIFGPKMAKAYAALCCGLLFSLLLVAIGKLHHDHHSSVQKSSTLQDYNGHVTKAIFDNIKGENIKQNLRAFTKEPHQAGTKANDIVADTIKGLYEQAGLHRVHKKTYDVLLSYPDWDRPNTLSITDRRGIDVFITRGVTPPIIQDEQSAPHAGHQWLAYSAPGRVEQDIVYANFGSPDDYTYLREQGISVQGKIVMVRYGHGFRGDKVMKAQQEGAVAIVIFSDPQQVARGNDVYPRTVWMPPDAVQRGSIMKLNGDALTPLYPAKVGAYKSRTIEEAKANHILPSIPALPISYSTAYQLFSRMSGPAAPSSWQGYINATYKLGPGLTDGQKVVVDVKSTLTTKQVNNVIGFIPGIEEEDRYVILGNHFDAWVYGSIDPNSGTAIITEVARAMMETINTTSWRPARTIMFASWDAEEYGLLGSNEFVEEFVQQLGTRAVAYLNMDCFQGNFSLEVDTVPTLYDLAVEVAKRVPNFNDQEVSLGRKTLYDTWVRVNPGKKGTNAPEIKIPGGGSDQGAFITYAGIPSIDFRTRNESKTGDTYPLYHSLFETPYVNEHLYDTDNFGAHRAIGRYWAELARTLSDNSLLPINATRLASEIATTYIPELRKELNRLSGAEINVAKQQLDLLAKTSEKFVHRAVAFDKHRNNTLKGLRMNPLDERRVRGINERLVMVDRCFVNPRGMPGAAHSRHILFSFSEKDSYSSRTMAAVYDAIEDFMESGDKVEAARAIAQQISIVYHAVNCATSSLGHFL